MWKLEEGLEINMAVAEIKNIKVYDDDRAHLQILDLAEEYNRKYAGISIGSVPRVSEGRKFFRKIGIDPTKHRPSSEALLNRALKHKGFNQVNSAVDVCNWCSLDFLLPICAYDSDKISGDVTARIGTADDNYIGHNRRQVNLQDRYLLADETAAFGSPITDSTRTAVDLKSINISLVIFAPQEYDTHKLDDQLTIFIDRIIGESAGICTFREILS